MPDKLDPPYHPASHNDIKGKLPNENLLVEWLNWRETDGHQNPLTTLFQIRSVYVLYSHLLQLYTYTCRIHIDAMNKRRTKSSLKKIYLSLYLKDLRVRRSWRPNTTAIYWPPLLWPSALCLSCSPGLLNRRPGGPLCWMQAFSTASCHQLIWSPTNWLPVFTELYNSSITHSIFGMACLIVIKQK